MSLKFRSSRSQMFFKIGVLKKYRKFHRKTSVLESLFNKLAGPQALLKTDSSTGAFQWNLRNFQDHAGGCFWKLEKCLCWTDVYPTTKQNRPQSNFEKKVPSSYREKIRWERVWQLNSCQEFLSKLPFL